MPHPARHRVLMLAAVGCALAHTAGLPAQTHAVAAPGTVVDTLFGTPVPDPFRHVERMDDPAVAAWMTAETERARALLDQNPQRAALLASIQRYREGGVATVAEVQRTPSGAHLYRKRVPGGAGKLYVRDGERAAERLLLDPAQLAGAPGERKVLKFFRPSPNGRHVLVGVSRSGVDVAEEIRVLEVATGREVDRVRREVWAPPGHPPHWHPNGGSFFYHESPADPAPGRPAAAPRILQHTLGTPGESDQAVFGYGLNPAVALRATASPQLQTVPGSRRAFAAVFNGTTPEIELWTVPLDSLAGPGTPWRRVAGPQDSIRWYAVHGDTVYLLTSRDAPRRKIVRTPLSAPDLSRAEVVVAEGEEAIHWMAGAADGLYLQSVGRAGGHRLSRTRWGARGAEPIPLPIEGSISELEGTDPRIPGVLVSLEGWTQGAGYWRYDPGAGRFTRTDLQPAGLFDDPGTLEVRVVSVPGHDGTPIPLTIVHRRGLQLDGSNPAILFGYGAYGSTYSPHYDVDKLAWFERGGIWAIAHVRGGGEGGSTWHAAGQKASKPNTWKDFIACAEYLVRERYTSPGSLAADGLSAGGILIGRSITERPELFAAAYDGVPMSDMIRYDSPSNVAEFGDVKTAEGFRILLAMSPYHHVRSGERYPALLVATGLRDTRVPPWQAAKMALQVRTASSSGRPVLLRVNPTGGHFDGSAELVADKWSFFLSQFARRE